MKNKVAQTLEEQILYHHICTRESAGVQEYFKAIISVSDIAKYLTLLLLTCTSDTHLIIPCDAI